MSEIQLLNADILERVDSLLRSRNAPIADAWAPGLSDAEIDETIGRAGLEMPEELRVWWRWHNGVRKDWPDRRPSIFPGRNVLSLQLTVEYYTSIGSGDGLLTPFSEKPRIHVASRSSGNVPAPVYLEIKEFEPQLEYESFGEFILAWMPGFGKA